MTNVAGLYNGLTNNTGFGGAPLITNAFLTQITWSGSNAAIGWSTIFGGTNFGVDIGYGVTVDPSGNVFVVGASSTTNFPAVNTPGLLQTTNSGGSDAFVMAFNTNGSAILYSGYLGGNGNDYGYGIAVDSQTNVYIGRPDRFRKFSDLFSVSVFPQGPQRRVPGQNWLDGGAAGDYHSANESDRGSRKAVTFTVTTPPARRH